MSLTNIQKAKTYHSAVSAYDVETIRKMVREDYIQHNPRVPTGRAAFLDLIPRLREHGTEIENARIFGDGSLVVMHHRWKNAHPFGAPEKVAFHIIRFDQAGLICEHWSVMADPQAPNPSGRSMIDGPTKVEDLDDTEANKEKTAALFSSLIGARPEDFEAALYRFFSPDFHQHHPALADGISGIAAAVANGSFAPTYERQHAVLGSGNFVLSICEGREREKPTAFYDLFRFEKGMIAEHWSIYQEIPTTGLANANTMFNF